ncbi:lmo0937 family membrane protein [Winogradskyella psychrotolerans]|uniref:lmo0937 family membrane protein n=1 Tax=Winogradskyella psychrotolerans TaxID=1344585 RepID=UPI001C067582|nr:lmo0937 family membrane protein [Winogradskyella psychrotolerans]MBU2920023.1 lmo0937 family membrane protein [Winogradskyella psychrotolerans]
MKTFLYVFLVLLVILWAIGFFVYALSAVIHIVLVIAIILLIVVNRNNSKD